MAVSSTSEKHRDAKRGADWLSPAEWRVVDAICETFFPALEPPAGSSAVLAAYYRRSGRDLGLAELLVETLKAENEEARAEFQQLLSLMSNPVSGLLLAGSLRPFAALSQARREKYLLAMANSPLAQLRQGYQALKRLTGFLYYAAPTVEEVNPNWEALDYRPMEAPLAPTVPTARPLQPLAITGDTVLEADVVVIGSGAGGGVVAGELAMAGKSVIVLEKGGYYSDGDFTAQEARSMAELYLKRGTLASKDLGVIILAGSALGGGTIVNWCTSFRTPSKILAEWEERSGLADCFTGAALQAGFAAVEQRLNINSENSVHNRQNQLLAAGCTALGYANGVLRRNVVGCEQRCGACCFGCPYGSKQSTMKTYLQDAYDHGARILTHCSADSILLQGGRAVGVKAMARDEAGATSNVTVHAKAVIVAAGSLHSPAILLRSGLNNPHIGRHLKLHPTAALAGVYGDAVHSWQGAMQTAYSDEFGYIDGNFGYKLEVPPAHPGLLGLATPWTGAYEYREQMTHTPNVATLIVLTRDKGEGSITLDRYGEPVVHYTVCVYDRGHLLHGMRKAARIHLAAGADALLSLHSKPARLQRPAAGAVSEQQWRVFDRQLEAHGMNANRVLIFSAHQMGTCRMGASPAQAVVDSNAEVFGVQGLFVCDASVFPAASGVNPMLSIMGLAHKASQYIKTVV